MNELKALSPQHVAMLRELRDQGCAVCVFLPHEMPDSSQRDVEDYMCQAGWGQINFDSDWKQDQKQHGRDLEDFDMHTKGEGDE